jgi:hypothetical protein
MGAPADEELTVEQCDAAISAIERLRARRRRTDHVLLQQLCDSTDVVRLKALLDGQASSWADEVSILRVFPPGSDLFAPHRIRCAPHVPPQPISTRPATPFVIRECDGAPFAQRRVHALLEAHARAHDRTAAQLHDETPPSKAEVEEARRALRRSARPDGVPVWNGGRATSRSGDPEALYWHEGRQCLVSGEASGKCRRRCERILVYEDAHKEAAEARIAHLHDLMQAERNAADPSSNSHRMDSLRAEVRRIRQTFPLGQDPVPYQCSNSTLTLSEALCETCRLSTRQAPVKYGKMVRRWKTGQDPLPFLPSPNEPLSS